MEESVKKVTKVVKKEKPGLNKNVVVTVDTPLEDIVKWDSEGYNIKFADTEKDFKTLTGAELKTLSLHVQQQYSMAMAIMAGIDVGMIEKPYDVTPGSAKDKLQVLGKDPKKYYSWQTPETMSRAAAKGYKVDTDPNVTNFRGETGLKYVGGQRNPEMVLMSADKEIIDANRAKKKARRDLAQTRNIEEYKETIARLGSKATVESFEK